MEGDELRHLLGIPLVTHPPDETTPLPPGIS